MDEGFAQDHEEYFETAFGRTIQSFKTPVLRAVPINRQLVANYPVAPFEDVLQVIENQEKIAVSPCVCRTTTHLAGKGCDSLIIVGLHENWTLSIRCRVSGVRCQ